jgi:bifunctional non-homologous end joining protein LigD
MRKRPGERQEPWLLSKATDEPARAARDPDILEDMPDSAASGRTMDQIAAGKRVWHSRPKGAGQTATQKKIAAAAKPVKPRGRARRTEASDSRDGKAVAGAKKSRLPDFVPPCLATLSSTAPDGGDWLHEIKLDGYRMQARIADKVSLKTRTGLDWTKRFPTIAEACAALGDDDAAVLEREAAREVFERLGAQHDLDRMSGAAATGSGSHGLTEREVEVLRLVASGRTNREIAEVLVLSEHTIRRHLQNIFTKLGVTSRTGATAFAFQHHLAEAPR